MTPKRLTLEEFNSVYSKVPRTCVELIIKSDQGILLTLRDIEPARGMWHLPGGTIYLDESLEDAIHRTAKAELGVTVEVVKLVEILDWYQTDWVNGHVISLQYEVVITSGQITLDNQASEYAYFKELPEKAIPIYAPLFEKLNISKNTD